MHLECFKSARKVNRLFLLSFVHTLTFSTITFSVAGQRQIPPDTTSRAHNFKSYFNCCHAWGGSSVAKKNGYSSNILPFPLVQTRIYKCHYEDCTSAFSRKGDLNRHTLIHTQDRLVVNLAGSWFFMEDYILQAPCLL